MATSTCETIEIVSTESPTGHVTINLSDYVEGEHEAYIETVKEETVKTPEPVVPPADTQSSTVKAEEANGAVKTPWTQG